MENLKIIFLFLILIATLLEIFADILLKKWVIEDKGLLFFLGLFIYFIGTLFWAFSLKYETISRAISIFTILNLLVIALLGVLLFKENLSLTNKIGIFIGVISIILIET